MLRLVHGMAPLTCRLLGTASAPILETIYMAVSNCGPILHTPQPPCAVMTTSCWEPPESGKVALLRACRLLVRTKHAVPLGKGGNKENLPGVPTCLPYTL